VTASTRLRSRPVPAWTPPLDSAALARLLEQFHAWQAYDGNALLDDVADALDDVMPADEHIGELTQRLRGHLMRLVNIALAAEAGEDAATASLIERARLVGAEELPGDPWKVVGYLRRMGWAVNELMERLVETRCLREAA
jgi:septation ring formation regulator EzrA